MRRFSLSRLLLLTLIMCVFARAGMAATMPIQMMGTAQGVVAMDRAPNEHTDCPGHAASAEQSDAPSCTFCGECCVTAPIFNFDPSAFLAKTAPQALALPTALPRISYLTPGLYRPPAFSL